ncbi:receptor-type tyrosine-protein phosphatase delta isoform X16 [Lampetra fluviatilis]
MSPVFARLPLLAMVAGALLVCLASCSRAETPPRFTHPPESQVGVSGGVASFVCRATGDPKPNITWAKKGKKLSSQRFEIIDYDNGASSVLRIQPLRPARDEAEYECVASNVLGQISKSVKLRVLREDQVPPGFPRIDMMPQLKVVERTRTATMLCAATGNPDPDIRWFKDFFPVDTQASAGRIKQLRTGSGPIRGALQIDLSEDSDQGKYECVASNDVGTVYSAPANLYVRVRHVPPRFSIPPKSQEIMPGGSVNVSCVAVGSPMPYVKWMSGGEDLTPEEEMPIGRNVLELSNVRESANYTCVAMSSLGVVEATAQVTVKALPRPPSMPVVTETTATSVTLTWDSGNAEPITYYVLRYRPITGGGGGGGAPDGRGHYQEIDGVATTRYTVGGLGPYSEYEFLVAAVNNIGRGSQSDAVLTRTSEQAPSSPPRNVQARMLSATTMLVTWEEPEEPNGQIRGYRVYYTTERGQPVSAWLKHNLEDSLLTTIGSLTPQADYTVRVLAFTSVGDGPHSPELHVKTQQGVPSQPINLKAEAESATSVLLSWIPPRQDSIIKYELLYRDGPLSKEQVVTFEPSMTYLLEGLRPNTLYQFRLAARSEHGLGAATSIVTAQTLPSTAFVKNFGVKSVSRSSALLTWELPDSYSPQQPFKIVVNNGQQIEVDGWATRKRIAGLLPNTEYYFGLASRGDGAGGLQQEVGVRTAPDLPQGKPLALGRVRPDGTLPTELPDPPEEVSLRAYYVVVVPLKRHKGRFVKPAEIPDDLDLDEIVDGGNQQRRRRRRRHGPVARAARDVEGPRPYVAARFPGGRLPADFTLGDGLEYGGHVNRRLSAGQDYVFFVLYELEPHDAGSRMFVASPYSDPVVSPDPEPLPITEEEEGLLWVVGPVLAVVFIICVVIAILLYKRKRSDSDPGKPMLPGGAKETSPLHTSDPVEMRRINFQTPGMINHPPIPIAELSDHVERLKSNNNLKFSQEYESIDPGQQFTWEHSNLEVNKPKNRYANVIAYDHSRVILQTQDGVPGSDYINANYMDGYRKQNAYIATQGPLPETFADFWRMVWEQRSSTIVMMTRLEERCRVKCDQYWPARGSETYGLVQVSLVDTLELASYAVRTFTLHKNGSNEKREVRQFQFTAWPDHGVPEYPTPFLAFLRRVKTCNPSDAGPMVVHCSAGVGRTGCFVVLDATLERLRSERTADVYGFVTCLRSQRNYTVQTEEQYVFVHEALLEAATAGPTEVPARTLYAHLQQLGTAEPGENTTRMQLEFRRLALGKSSPSRFISANLPCNKFKNRLVNVMPYEATRVPLQPIRGVEGSDYINASFVDGYRQQAAYIATQGPMAETTEDFWRMLWEHNSTIVVMLTKLREMGREKCHQYWPAERSARYQYFVVDPMAEYNMPQYILREFKVTDARDGQSRTVRQFQFTDWPEQGVPKSGEGFIDFIGQVHKTKEQFGQDGPITVHCSAGVGRTGVFITLSIVLERMRYEGVVDVFQTVKMLRTQRPAAVQTEDQYQLCYRAALEYLGSFDHYAT